MKIQELNEAFTMTTRNDAEIYTLKDGSPEWMSEAIFKAHQALDDRMPDDWIYEIVASFASSYCGYTDPNEDSVFEIVDSLVDIYTHDLTRWLSSHLGNVALCDTAQSEGLVPEDATLDARIRTGQFYAINQIAGAILGAL